MQSASLSHKLSIVEIKKSNLRNESQTCFYLTKEKLYKEKGLKQKNV